MNPTLISRSWTPILAVAALTGTATAQFLVRSLPAVRPDPIDGPRLAFDPGRGVTTLFGGLRTAWNQGTPTLVVVDETWDHDGQTWTQRRPTASPAARYGHGLCGTAGGVLLFGGDDYGQSPTLFDDTWSWNGATWQRLQPVNRPSARSGMVLVADNARNRAVLYGGWDLSATLGDTWEWTGTDWQSIATAATPGPRALAAAAYDLARGRIVLFGGSDGSMTMTDATWEYDGTNWTQANPTTIPPARGLATMTYDVVHGVTVLAGGADAMLNGLPDIWHWNGTDWTAVATTLPEPQTDAGAGYDPVHGRSLLFGGSAFDPGTGAFNSIEGTDLYHAAGALNASYTPFGSGCPGSGNATPTLAAVPGGAPVLGTTFAAIVEPVDPAASLVLFAMGFSDQTWGGNTLPLSLAPFGLAGCTLAIALDGLVSLTPADGRALWRITVPTVPALSGLAFFNQALVLDSGASNGIAALTNGCRGTIQ